jgi:hypothetical protein
LGQQSLSSISIRRWRSILPFSRDLSFPGYASFSLQQNAGYRLTQKNREKKSPDCSGDFFFIC